MATDGVAELAFDTLEQKLGGKRRNPPSGYGWLNREFSNVRLRIVVQGADGEVGEADVIFDGIGGQEVRPTTPDNVPPISVLIENEKLDRLLDPEDPYNVVAAATLGDLIVQGDLDLLVENLGQLLAAFPYKPLRQL